MHSRAPHNLTYSRTLRSHANSRSSRSSTHPYLCVSKEGDAPCFVWYWMILPERKIPTAYFCRLTAFTCFKQHLCLLSQAHQPIVLSTFVPSSFLSSPPPPPPPPPPSRWSPSPSPSPSLSESDSIYIIPLPTFPKTWVQIVTDVIIGFEFFTSLLLLYSLFIIPVQLSFWNTDEVQLCPLITFHVRFAISDVNITDCLRLRCP